MSIKKETFQKIFNKTTIRVVTILVGILLVVVISIAQFALDPNNFNVTTWLSNTILLIGIQMVFMILGEGVGKDYSENNQSGIYQQALKKYRETRANCDKYSIYFNEYHSYYRVKELHRKIENNLINAGILQGIEIYRNLSEKEINDLEFEPIEKNGIEFIQLTHNQVEMVLKIIHETKIGETTPDYYLSEYATAEYFSDQDKVSLIAKKIKTIRWSTRFFKIFISVAISLVWSMFTVQEVMKGDDIQAYVNLTSRVFSCITGLLSGWLTSISLNYLTTDNLRDKELFLSKFILAIENKTFVPTDIHEVFLKQKEEAKKRKVDVEVVDNTPLQLENKIGGIELK